MDTNLIQATIVELGAEQVFTIMSSRVFDGKMSLDQAWSLWDHYLEHGKSPADLRSCLNRFDWSINRKVGKPGRSKEQVEKGFKEGTEAETEIRKQFVAGMRAAGHTIRYKGTGVANKGETFYEARDTSPEDYEFGIDGGSMERVEIKHSPVFGKCTLKVADLENYQKRKSNMLLLFDTGYPQKLSNLPSSRWTYLGPDTITSILTLEHGRYREMGGKICVQFGPAAKTPDGKRRPIEYSTLFKHHPWGDFTGFAGPQNTKIDFKGA